MKNKFTKIAEILRMIPGDEPITYSRLATIFEEIGKMEDLKTSQGRIAAVKAFKN